MKSNMGSTDKILRFVFGLIIIALGIVYESWWGVIGVIPLFTSIFSWCPLYVPLKMSTRKSKEG